MGRQGKAKQGKARADNSSNGLYLRLFSINNRNTFFQWNTKAGFQSYYEFYGIPGSDSFVLRPAQKAG